MGALLRVLIWVFIVALGVACRAAPEPTTALSTPAPRASFTATATVVVRQAEGGASSARIAGVEVSPPFLQVAAGESVRLRATAFDRSLREVAVTRLLWEVLDGQAGTISDQGVFTAGTRPGFYSGAVQVTAAAGSGPSAHQVSTLVPVIVEGAVEEARLTAIRIIPDPLTALQGQVLTLYAVGLDQRGVAIPSVRFSWSLQESSSGRMGPSGVLTVTGPAGAYRGAIQVEAQYGGVVLRQEAQLNIRDNYPAFEMMSLQVIPDFVRLRPGGNVDFLALALDKSGQPVRDVDVHWSVVGGMAGSFGDAGRFQAGSRPGLYPNAIQVEAVQRVGDKTLTSRAVATVVIEEEAETLVLDSALLVPGRAVLLAGEARVFAARALDRFGRALPGAAISWRVLDEAAGSVTADGVFTASGQAGAYFQALEVRVERDGVVRQATADVTIAGALAQASIEPVTVEVGTGQGIRFVARGIDSNGVEVPGVVFQWQVLDPRAGAIDQLGRFTAGDTPGVYEGAVQVQVIQR